MNYKQINETITKEDIKKEIQSKCFYLEKELKKYKIIKNEKIELEKSKYNQTKIEELKENDCFKQLLNKELKELYLNISRRKKAISKIKEKAPNFYYNTMKKIITTEQALIKIECFSTYERFNILKNSI